MISGPFRPALVHGAVTAILLIVPPPSARAQQVGVKAGVNFASLTPEENEDPDDSRRVGPIAGAWLRTRASGRISYQFEGLFSEKGVKFKAPAIGLEAADLRIRYVEVPAMIRAGLGAAGPAARAFVVGGAAPSFKLSARAKARSEGQQHVTDPGDEVYSFDVGLVGGFGLAVGRALVETRYTHGLRHINTDDNGDEDRIKNRVFSVMAGLRLR